MSNFEKRTSEDGEAIECDCCGYWTETVKHTTHTEASIRDGNRQGEEFHLCRICYDTHLSKALFYPSQCDDPVIYKSLAWLGNFLRDEIRSR